MGKAQAQIGDHFVICSKELLIIFAHKDFKTINNMCGIGGDKLLNSIVDVFYMGVRKASVSHINEKKSSKPWHTQLHMN